MPVGRVILKSISDSHKLPKLKTDGARLLYTWLLTHLDVNGCFSGDPQVIKGKVFTRLNKSTKAVENYLNDMEENKLIIRYKVNGDIFLNVPDFVEKQPSLNPLREGKTTIPTPTPDLLQINSVTTPMQFKLSKDKLSKDNIVDKSEDLPIHIPNKTPYKEIKNLYNTICISLPKATILTPAREKAISTRWKKFNKLAVYEELFQRAEDSDFLSGRNSKWTSCNFDWLLNESNMVKVLEGNYENRGKE